ncbi:hypothetical protein XM38_036110 [Halomicronema hongdechloris C2206]|uniref:Uncharacterized protein n=1 Tax=Halomicronema hongdechloris C2206 TaxID=1641165 RepID=A0A1Z3HQR6_9CYAN|nr:hypothetical protein [Halomicronema hongdechloris]ASC72653.1 hypothetical protein XM38_036110 [Halomicronema hongdechloris C2206]
MIRQTLIGLGTLSILAAGTVSVNASTDLQVVDSAALGIRRDLPWSEPVQIDDPFEGQFIGVFDRNYFFDQFLNARARIEIQSLWSPESVRVLLMTRDRDCSGHSIHHGTLLDLGCLELTTSRKVTELFVRVDEQVFQVSGENNLFQVSDEFAQALQTAPHENVSIRLVTETGEVVDSEIGQGTVEAWKTVYTD